MIVRITKLIREITIGHCNNDAINSFIVKLVTAQVTPLPHCQKQTKTIIELP